MPTNRKAMAIVGAMRSGKSHFAEKQLKRFCEAGGFGVVYGAGKPQDWSFAVPLELVDCKAQRQACKAAKIEWDGLVWYARHGTQIYRLDQLPVAFKGRAVKFFDHDPNTNRAFAQQAFKFFGNSFIIFDDCRNIFRQGIPSEFLGLISRVNHVGNQSPYKELRGKGADVGFIFHGLGQVNPEFWTYLTDIVQFYTPPTETPDFKAVDNETIRQALISNTEILGKMPKYSFTHYEPSSGSIKKYTAKP